MVTHTCDKFIMKKKRKRNKKSLMTEQDKCMVIWHSALLFCSSLFLFILCKLQYLDCGSAARSPFRRPAISVSCLDAWINLV